MYVFGVDLDGMAVRQAGMNRYAELLEEIWIVARSFGAWTDGQVPGMTEKSAFNAEEWATVVEGPAIAGLAVAAVERGGTLRESLSLAKAFAAAQREAPTQLVQEIVGSAPTIDRSSLTSRNDLPDHAARRLREAVLVVERVATPEELEDYRHFVLEAARTVAQAHKEGGVLGIGGRPVSEKEQAVLDQLAGAVDSGAG